MQQVVFPLPTGPNTIRPNASFAMKRLSIGGALYLIKVEIGHLFSQSYSLRYSLSISSRSTKQLSIVGKVGAPSEGVGRRCPQAVKLSSAQYYINTYSYCCQYPSHPYHFGRRGGVPVRGRTEASALQRRSNL